MEEYCYKIPYYFEVEQAIICALEKEPNLVSQEFLENWKNNKILLPISILNKACKINRKDPLVPVKCQFTWFCLHRKSIIRTQPSGRILKPKVYFAPVYVEKKEILIKFLLKSIKKCGEKKKFSELIGYSINSLDEWLNLNCVRKAPITAYIKASQILNVNVWSLLNGIKLYGKTSKDYFLFKEDFSEIEKLLIWIEAEGTILFNRRAIQIRQNLNGIDALHTIKKKFKKIFNLDENNLTITEDQKNQFKLNIYISPLRQILVLKYGLQLGYKIYSDIPNSLFNFKNRKDGIEKVAKHFETEGCVSFQRRYKTIKPIFSISSRNEKKIENLVKMIKKLGWNAKKYEWLSDTRKMFSACVYRKYEVLDLCENILPYLWHEGKKKNIIKIFNFME